MSIVGLMADIARNVSATVGAGYWPGMLRWAGAATYDDGGSIASPGTPESHGCWVQVDSATERMRQADGYRDTDMRLLILADDLERDPDTDAAAEVLDGPHAGSWRLLSVTRDPGGCYFEAAGRRA